MIFYYAFDREMLNSIGFSEKDRRSQKAIETTIENELKALIFFMPLDEKVVISPSFRFESSVFWRILQRNREFVDKGIIAEYRRETDVRDFWLKKNETYRKAMDISDSYRVAYGSDNIYKEKSSIWIERIPKQQAIGFSSRDAFMENIRSRGKICNIPLKDIEDVLKITEETRETTFLWEVEEAMLRQYGISNNTINRLCVRESMNQSYLNVFAEQQIEICKSTLGIVDIGCTNPFYDMSRIKPILERLGVWNTVVSMSAARILSIRSNPDLQNILDVIRKKTGKGKKIEEIYKTALASGDIQTIINKIDLLSFGGDTMKNATFVKNEILQEGTRRILHLSDLHFTDEKTMESHYFHLKLDLKNSFKIEKIDYLIISGDVCDRPKEEMYKAACNFVQSLSRDFNISNERIILAIGNHDCERDISKEAYNNRKNSIANEQKYKERFNTYSKCFYEPLKGRAYPLEPQDQHEDNIFDDDKLCFLALNSCWKIDHKNTDRSSICMDALQRSDCIWCEPKDYIKLAVWHHPLSGWQPIQDTTFMETLATAGFKACFHGHVHEAKNELFTYDTDHNIKMIGAGTFGALKEDRGAGIPLQYNMIELDRERRLLIVHTRKREKDNGAWQADARWGDKNKNPQSYYCVDV